MNSDQLIINFRYPICEYLNNFGPTNNQNKNTQLKKLILIIGIAGVSLVSAQSLAPEVIASGGASFSSASAKIEFTIGEVATSTLTSGSNILTQGFHQPKIQFSSIQNYNDDYVFTIYPNPTEQFVTVESTKADDMRLHVYDANGKAIYVSSIFQQKITVDLEFLAAGSYVLRITTKAGVSLHSYTVIKKSTY